MVRRDSARPPCFFHSRCDTNYPTFLAFEAIRRRDGRRERLRQCDGFAEKATGDPEAAENPGRPQERDGVAQAPVEYVEVLRYGLHQTAVWGHAEGQWECFGCLPEYFGELCDGCVHSEEFGECWCDVWCELFDVEWLVEISDRQNVLQVKVHNILPILSKLLMQHKEIDGVNGRIFRIVGNICRHWGRLAPAIFDKEPELVRHIVDYLKNSAAGDNSFSSSATVNMGIRALR